VQSQPQWPLPAPLSAVVINWTFFKISLPSLSLNSITCFPFSSVEAFLESKPAAYIPLVAYVPNVLATSVTFQILTESSAVLIHAFV
jgi:hypothetical protein